MRICSLYVPKHYMEGQVSLLYLLRKIPLSTGNNKFIYEMEINTDLDVAV